MSVVCLAWQGRVLKDDSKRINEYLIQNGQKVIVIIQKGTQAAQKYWNSLSSALSVSSPVGSGTLTYSGPTGLASQAILGHLTAAFQRAAQRTQDSSAMRGSSWIELLQQIRKYSGMPINFQEPVSELSNSLKRTSDSLHSLANMLACLSLEVKSKTPSKPSVNLNTVSTNCQSNSVFLGLLGAAINDFSGSSCYTEVTPQGVISAVHSNFREFSAEATEPTFILNRNNLKYSIVSRKEIMSSLHTHDHATFSYDTQEVAMQVALEVILSGLATGRGLLVMRSAKQIAATLQALSDMGIDTKTLIDSGRMTTVTNTFYYEDREAEERGKLSFTFCEEAIRRSGCSEVNVVGEVSYLPPDQEFTPEFKARLQQQVVVYEHAITETLYGQLPLSGVCLYDKSCFPPDFVEAAERAHNIVLAVAT